MRNVGMMRIAVRRITNCLKKNDEKNSDWGFGNDVMDVNKDNFLNGKNEEDNDDDNCADKQDEKFEERDNWGDK